MKPSNLYAGIDTTDPGSRRTCSDDLRSSIHTKSENVKMPLFLGKFTKLFPCNFTSIIISKITNFKLVILQSI